MVRDRSQTAPPRGSSTMILWRFKRLIWALQLFAGIVYRETADGSRMTIKHAWQTAGVNKRAKELCHGRGSI
jgi:hypothetical protein